MITTPNLIQTDFLATWDMVLDNPIPIGGPKGNRLIIRVAEGRIEGPRISGKTLAMTGDWPLVRSDGVGELDVRSTIQTDDGEMIYMHYRGLMHGTPETMQAVFGGQPVAFEDLYFRMAAFFETGSAKYSWLNKTLCVGNAVVALPKLTASLFTLR